ncbi:MAG: DUF2442 domain-containing protein [Candidatus Thermoplasmatota archaeon]|nr:DUF2442 domain-containing protein [Candidatus Thermoplasmatota archaeon]
MKKIHNIQKIEFKEDKMILRVDDKEYVFHIEKISKRLLNASKLEREKFEISPSGYGVHWPLIDEDVSIDGLIGISHAPQQPDKIVMR